MVDRGCGVHNGIGVGTCCSSFEVKDLKWDLASITTTMTIENDNDMTIIMTDSTTSHSIIITSQALQPPGEKLPPGVPGCSSTPLRPSSGRAQLPVKACVGGRVYLQPPLPVLAGKPDCFIPDHPCAMQCFPTDVSCVCALDPSDPKSDSSIHS